MTIDSGTVIAIVLPCCLVIAGFFITYKETRRIHQVVNSRLTAALAQISTLEETITELRSTPASRKKSRAKT